MYLKDSRRLDHPYKVILHPDVQQLRWTLRINNAALCDVLRRSGTQHLWEKYQASSVYVRKERIPTRFIKRIVYNLEELKPPEWAQRNTYTTCCPNSSSLQVSASSNLILWKTDVFTAIHLTGVKVNTWTNKTTIEPSPNRPTIPSKMLISIRLLIFCMFSKGV